MDDDGYVYKKGRSRSKHARGVSDDDDEGSKQAKRPKTTESVRIQRIAHVEEAIDDVRKQIHYKEMRREQASNAHKYQLCENITEEISTLKQRRFELVSELKLLRRKQQQSVWYQNKKTRFEKHSDSEPSVLSYSTSEQESSSFLCPGSTTPSCSRSSTPFSDQSLFDSASCALLPGSSPRPLSSTPHSPSMDSQVPGDPAVFCEPQVSVVGSPEAIELSSDDSSEESSFQ